MQPFRLEQEEWDKAIIVWCLDENSHEVETASGNNRRNRAHLIKTKEVPPQMSLGTHIGEKLLVTIPTLETPIMQSP